MGLTCPSLSDPSGPWTKVSDRLESLSNTERLKMLLRSLNNLRTDNKLWLYITWNKAVLVPVTATLVMSQIKILSFCLSERFLQCTFSYWSFPRRFDFVNLHWILRSRFLRATISQRDTSSASYKILMPRLYLKHFSSALSVTVNTRI